MGLVGESKRLVRAGRRLVSEKLIVRMMNWLEQIGGWWLERACHWLEVQGGWLKRRKSWLEGVGSGERRGLVRGRGGWSEGDGAG